MSDQPPAKIVCVDGPHVPAMASDEDLVSMFLETLSERTRLAYGWGDLTSLPDFGKARIVAPLLPPISRRCMAAATGPRPKLISQKNICPFETAGR